jgi:hypothetical protein
MLSLMYYDISMIIFKYVYKTFKYNTQTTYLLFKHYLILVYIIYLYIY